MRMLVLGAGQDVGKSCVVIRLGGRTLMLDCGMHLGYQDARRFPDFSLLAPDGDFSRCVDAVLISHFHLDHVGALPYLTEVCGYSGPIVMTHPTAALAPLLLYDYHRVLTQRPGTGPLFSRAHIGACMARVTPLDQFETAEVCEGVEVTAYPAGHVLGAVMLHVRVGSESILYTGDFNTSPDRHLAGAVLPRLAPDLIISEATYAAAVREGRGARETGLLAAVAAAVGHGGKVLVPVFAVGRAQELLAALDELWDRQGLQAPIYVSGPLAARASQAYRLLSHWCTGRLRNAGNSSSSAGDARAGSGGFGSVRAQPWRQELLDEPGACVLFATPGMLQGGLSLQAFKAWAADPCNLVVLPSYQVAGTLGRRLMLGQRRGIVVDRTTIDVNCKIHYAAVSAHADAKGILQLLYQVQPRAVALVHGESDKMAFLASKITDSLGVPCYTPANGQELKITAAGGCTAVPVSARLLARLPAPTVGCAASGDSGVTAAAAAEAAAQSLRASDTAALVDTAMRLAGLTLPAARQIDGQPAPPAAATCAASHAAQLAAWLELLAGAAHDRLGAEQQQQKQQQQQQQQEQKQQEQVQQQEQDRDLPVAQSLHTAQLQGRGQQHPTAQTAVLSERLRLRYSQDSSNKMSLSGVLVVQHREQQQNQQQQQQQQELCSAVLLSPEEAATRLHLQAHRVLQRCRVCLPCLPDGCSALTAAQQLLAAGLHHKVAHEMQLMHVVPPCSAAGDAADKEPQLQLRTLCVTLCDPLTRCLEVTWELHDDAVAQHCLALLRGGVARSGGNGCNMP